MQALVLEEKNKLSLRDFPLEEWLGPRDVRIAVKTVGICGSDLHYYSHGAIGPFVVREPMILGHEASGEVLEVGSEVENLQPGDRVCMEPGIPDPHSRASRLGLYNLDPAVRFWATPPIHGCLRPEVVHPADYTFRLPDTVGYDEGAMVEPLAVGLHAVSKAGIRPGDTAVVIGAGPIGLVTALSALAGGAARVILSDVIEEKLTLGASLGPIQTVNATRENLASVVSKATGGWGADQVFECSGNPRATAAVFEPLCPGGTVVLVGMPTEAVSMDIVAAQVKEARIETVFRYAHVYPRALALMGSGQLNVKPLLTHRFPFEKSIEAFDFAAQMPADGVKVQIDL